MEPTLENIEDYSALKGQKKKIVWLVIATGIAFGALFTYFNATTNVDDALVPQEKGSLIMHKDYSQLPPKY